jgi:endonuclease/exonuclease/phosphatase family metal-dependent hydrolase
LAVSEGEETVRRFESHLLRERIDEILIQNPRENLLVYGDFNDTKDQACIQTILGLRGSPSALTDLPARDSVNDLWTHFWRAGDVYARIDYLLVSRGLLPEILPDRTRIDRSRHWNLASDHRLISTTLIPIEKKKP